MYLFDLENKRKCNCQILRSLYIAIVTHRLFGRCVYFSKYESHRSDVPFEVEIAETSFSCDLFPVPDSQVTKLISDGGREHVLLQCNNPKAPLLLFESTRSSGSPWISLPPMKCPCHCIVLHGFRLEPSNLDVVSS